MLLFFNLLAENFWILHNESTCSTSASFCILNRFAKPCTRIGGISTFILLPFFNKIYIWKVLELDPNLRVKKKVCRERNAHIFIHFAHFFNAVEKKGWGGETSPQNEWRKIKTSKPSHYLFVGVHWEFFDVDLVALGSVKKVKAESLFICSFHLLIRSNSSENTK